MPTLSIPIIVVLADLRGEQLAVATAPPRLSPPIGRSYPCILLSASEGRGRQNRRGIRQGSDHLINSHRFGRRREGRQAGTPVGRRRTRCSRPWPLLSRRGAGEAARRQQTRMPSSSSSDADHGGARCSFLLSGCNVARDNDPWLETKDTDRWRGLSSH